MGTATVDSVEIVHDDSNGNVKLTGDAHWMIFHGTGTYEFGPDGIPIQPTVTASGHGSAPALALALPLPKHERCFGDGGATREHCSVLACSGKSALDSRR